MCISRSHTVISLTSSSMGAHLLGYPWRLVKIWGSILASSYCSRKVSTLKHQSMSITSTPGSVDLKIGISNLTGVSHSSPYSLCSLCTYAGGLQSHSQWSIHQSLVPPGHGRRGANPPPTIVHWDFSGLPCRCAAPVWVVSLASVTSSTPEALPAC